MAVNLWVCLKWSGLEFTDNRSSIEWAYLALARYIGEHGFHTIYGDAEWFPYWYNGVPFENTYPPLLHYLVAISAKLANVSAGRAYHAVTGAFVCLGPLGVYFLSLRWTKHVGASTAAALFYTLLSPCSWLMPTIARDLNGLWMNQRMNVLASYGEGPHLASLALLPLAMLAFNRALERPGWRRTAVAAFACALVPLCNIIGGFALAWACLAVLLARGCRLAPHAAVIGLWAYLLSLRWLNPAMLSDIARNAPFLGELYPMDALHCAALAGLLAATVGAALLLRRYGAPLAVVGGVAFTLPMTVIPLSWEFASFYFIPQPARYHLEMDLGLALLAASLLVRAPAFVSIVASVVLLIFAALHGQAFDRFIQSLRYRETWEYRITHWMANQDPQARVYFQGSPRYFAGVDHDQVQFGGGFANGIKIPAYFLADFGITASKGESTATIAWLKAFGIDFVAVGDASTENPVKVWGDPGKFDGALREVWRERGDFILETGRSNESLAHAIPRDVIVKNRPTHFYDVSEISRYVAAMEGEASNGGTLTWLSPSTASIEAHLRPRDVISVQIAHDSRWTATVDGKRWPIHEDGMGQMYIDAPNKSPAKIQLAFHNPPLLFLICGVAWLIWLGALADFRMSKQKPSS